MRYNEAMRLIESSKRELFATLENEKMRSNSLITENKDSTYLIMNDRIEKAKEDLTSRIRDIEKVNFLNFTDFHLRYKPKNMKSMILVNWNIVDE